jgi:DNA-binding beta-propeller fold protein YncE
VWSAGDTRFATQIGSDVWIVDPATGGTVKVPGVGGALAFTPDGTRVVVGGRQWSTVSVDGGPLTPVTGAGWVPDPYAPRLEPFQRDIWFAGSRVYAVGRGGALFTAAAL